MKCILYKKIIYQFIIECAKRVSADKGFIKAPIVIGEALGLVEQLVGDTFRISLETIN